MHELHHVLLGPHAPLPARDARAQPRLRRRHQRAALRAVPGAGLHVLLHAAVRRGEGAAAPAGAARRRARASPPRLAALHAALYEGRATAEEVFHAHRHGGGGRAGRRSPRCSARTAGAKAEWGTEGPADPAVVDAIRRIVEKWPPPETPIRGRSLADVLKAETVTPAPAVDAAVLAATRKRPPGRRRPWPEGRASRGGAAARRSSRCPTRATGGPACARALGATPLLYRSTLVDPRGRGDGATHVYLDVSGSMDPWLEDLYAALAALRRHIAPDVHLFSTRVETVPLRRCSRAVARRPAAPTSRASSSTRSAGRARRVLLVTDGYVGPRRPQLGRGRRRGAGSSSACCSRRAAGARDLEPLAVRIEELPSRDATPAAKEERMTERLRFAEAVCAGHPDRLADTIAERIVGARPRARPRRARRRRGGAPPQRRLRRRPRRRGAGARPPSTEGEIVAPRPAGVRRRRLRQRRRPASSGPSRTSSRCGPTSASARSPRTSAPIRDVSDDQSICVGHAVVGPPRRPPPARAGAGRPTSRARWSGSASSGRTSASARTARCLVVVRGRTLVGVSLSLHHAPGVDWVALTREARAACEAVAGEYVDGRRARAARAGGGLARQRRRRLRGRRPPRRQRPLGQEARRPGLRLRRADRRGSDAAARTRARSTRAARPSPGSSPSSAVCRATAREATVWLAYRPGDLTPRWVEVVALPDDDLTEDEPSSTSGRAPRTPTGRT